MTDTPNLGLPLIEASQAQKHVTHNEALSVLDTLVQLAVLSRALTAPPSSPAEGNRYIVKATATGAFAGKENQVAQFSIGGWIFYPPQPGWVAFVVDEGALLAWSGSVWSPVSSSGTITSLQNLTLLGVGTTADSTNPLSVKLNNALFVAKTVAESGDGTLRYKLSKESASKTLSFLFQDNFSGRAEIGLTGDDDFHFKVSPDGSSWIDALIVDKTTGSAKFYAAELPNTGLKIRDTNASDLLTIKPGSDLTAARIFTLTTGDANRTLDISAADVTVSSFIATLLDDTNAATARATLGVPSSASWGDPVASWAYSTNIASVIFSSLGAYREIMVVAIDLQHDNGTSQNFGVELSTDNGSTFKSTNGDYHRYGVSSGTNRFLISGAVAASTSVGGFVEIADFNVSSRRSFARMGGGPIDANGASIQPGSMNVAEAYNALKVRPGTGNLIAGTIYIYGKA